MVSLGLKSELGGGSGADRNERDCLIHHDRGTSQTRTAAGGCGRQVGSVCCHE